MPTQNLLAVKTLQDSTESFSEDDASTDCSFEIKLDAEIEKALNGQFLLHNLRIEKIEQTELCFGVHFNYLECDLVLENLEGFSLQLREDLLMTTPAELFIEMVHRGRSDFFYSLDSKTPFDRLSRVVNQRSA